jgi:hypothetical protein
VSSRRDPLCSPWSSASPIFDIGLASDLLSAVDLPSEPDSLRSCASSRHVCTNNTISPPTDETKEMANRANYPSIIGFNSISPNALATEIIAQHEAAGEFIVVKRCKCSG